VLPYSSINKLNDCDCIISSKNGRCDLGRFAKNPCASKRVEYYILSSFPVFTDGKVKNL